MNYKLAAILAMLAGLCGCEQATQTSTATDATPAPVAAEPEPLHSGIDMTGFDPETRPQDDFYNYVNGTWLKETEIPADKSNYGSFNIVADTTEANLRALIDEVREDESAAPGTAAQKIRDFYNTYMDEESADAAGIEAIAPELEAIAAAQNHDDLLRLFGEMSTYGVSGPFGTAIFADLNDANMNAVYVNEAGLTLPDRDYYLEDTDQYIKGRELYRKYVEDLYALAGLENGEQTAGELLALETRLAEFHWTREDNRDPNKYNNPMTPEQLQELSPLVDWDAYMESQGITAREEYNIGQPSYLAAVDDIFVETSIETWKNYLVFKTLNAYGSVLTTEMFDLWFGFNRAGLSGVPEPQPRWKRAVASATNNMGFLIGQLYVERHFPPEAKERMIVMIDNLTQAYHDSITNLEWMSEETRIAALEKLSKFTTKIGYPDEWRDYSSMEIVRGSLIKISGAQMSSNNAACLPGLISQWTSANGPGHPSL